MELGEVETFISELETRVDRLRALYDQYFMGIEKLEPTVPRKDVDRRIQALRKEQIRNTGLRFRFQMILQRYSTYQTYWQRICRQIEDGTFKRHVAKAQARFGDAATPGLARSGKTPAKPELDKELDDIFAGLESAPSSMDTDFGMLEPDRVTDPPPSPPPHAPTERQLRVAPQAAAPSQPVVARPISLAAPKGGPVWRKAAPAQPRDTAPAPPPQVTNSAPPRQAPPTPAPQQSAAPPRPPARPAAPPPPLTRQPSRPDPDLPDERVKQLYAQYVDTKRKQNESTAAITYDGLAKSLRESSARLRQKHGRPIDFEVTVKDGKTILRPVVK